MARRFPTRIRSAPKRFATLTFTPGSGVVGCDHYDHSYDRGYFSTTWKDLRQRIDDEDYSRDLKKALAAEEASNIAILPIELQREVKKLLVGPSLFQNDVNFIAPDTTPETVELASDESEWESEEEDCEYCCEVCEEKCYDFECVQDALDAEWTRSLEEFDGWVCNECCHDYENFEDDE